MSNFASVLYSQNGDDICQNGSDSSSLYCVWKFEYRINYRSVTKLQNGISTRNSSLDIRNTEFGIRNSKFGMLKHYNIWFLATN